MHPDHNLDAASTNLELTHGEVSLLIEALGSHEYWELSASNERNNGYSTIEDGTNPEVDAARALAAKLERRAQPRT